MAKKPILKKNAPSSVKGNAQPTSPPNLAKAPEMPYAELEHVQGGSLLDPLDGKYGIKAKVFTPTGSTGCTFHWKVDDYPNLEFSPLDVPSDTVEVTVPPDWISRCIALTVSYWYEAFVNGVHHKSLVGELFVQSLREDQTEDSLPELPQVVEESNTRWLKMQDFKGDALLRFNAPPMAVEGMRLYVVVVGDEHLADPPFLWLEFGRPISRQEADPSHIFEYKIGRWWLARRTDWSSFTISLAWLYHGNQGEFDTSDPLNHRYLPKNGEDFHSRYTTLLRVDPWLDLLPPHLVESTLCSDGKYVLNPTNSAKGGHVRANYDGMTEGDVVCCTVFGEDLPTVPLGCMTVPSGGTEVLFDLPARIIAASFNRSLRLTYNVQFGNNPAQTSPERMVHVLTPQLTKPNIEQATGNTLALKTFSGDATAYVPIWDYAAVGQCVWVWITGTQVDGSPCLFYSLMDEPLTIDWLTNGVDAPISRTELQKLEDCSEFKLHAAVSFDGKCDLATAFEFPVQTFNIDQEDLVLDAADVLEAVGNQLKIYNAKDGMTVRVAYPHISDKHEIQLKVKRADGTYIPSNPQLGDGELGYVEFSIDRKEVIHASDKTLTINYTVTSACKQQTSADLNLEISRPVRLKTPVVPQATPPAVQDGILDLRCFSGDADITLEPWWFILEFQICWLECRGTKEDGTSYTIKVMTQEPIGRGDLNGLLRILPRAELEKLRDKTELTVIFKVTANGSIEQADAIEFTQLKLGFRKAYRDLTDFNNQTFGKWEEGAGVGDPRDLTFQPIDGPDGKPGYSVRNYTFTENSVGPILQRLFDDLDSGHRYKFSIKVRSYGPGLPVPQLSLSKDGVRQTLILALTDLAWHTLEFTFLAEGDAVRLDIYSHTASGTANDWFMNDFLVEEA